MPWGMKNILVQLFGSSIMEGRLGVDKAADRWYEIMRGQLAELFPAVCFSIHNSAVGGESLRELMAHFDTDFTGHTPDFCLAMFAWNNFDMEHPARIVPLAEQEQLCEAFFRKLPAQTAVIGVIAQPMLDRYHSVNSSLAYDEIRAKYGSVNAFHDLERDLHRRIFRAHGCPFLDLSKLMADEPEKYILTADGIHLSPDGHRLFATAMTGLVQPLIQP